MLSEKICIKKGILALSMVVGVGLMAGVGFAQTNPFPDNPSPFPYTHKDLGGTGGQLGGGQLVTFQGTQGSGNFFFQEFVNVDPDGVGGQAPQLSIHTVLESVAGSNAFLQESFVMMGDQRSPVTQDNSPSPITLTPGHTNIAFRQSVKDTNFSSLASLDPLQNIHISQKLASPTAENGQVGGLTFSNVDIMPNRGNASNSTETVGITCGTGSTAPIFCTTISQEVKVLDPVTGANNFSQTADFVTGGTVKLVQGP
jgi:hypothetical protein